MSCDVTNSGGVINVIFPATLKANAWVPGLRPSNVAAADYVSAGVDSDADGILDTEELNIGTNPYNRDTDGDGVDDNVEIANGTDPRFDNGFNDPDGDGLKNAEEAFLGTDPNVNNLPGGSTGVVHLYTPLE